MFALMNNSLFITIKNLFVVLCLFLIVDGCSGVSNGVSESGSNEQCPLKINVMKLSTGFSMTSVNTSVFRANSITSDDQYQFVSYYNEDGQIIIAKRDIHTDKWIIHETNIFGDCSRAYEDPMYSDGHKSISIGLDGEGFLHLCYDMHSNRMKYRKSLVPYSCVFGPNVYMVDSLDEQDVTYPEFWRLKNGNMLFTYRWGDEIIFNEYSIVDRKWRRRQEGLIIDREDQFSTYWQMYLDNNDNILLSWLWREIGDPCSNHDLFYATSKNGYEWRNSKKEIYSLPINTSTAELAWAIPKNRDYINQNSMAVDKDGNPYIALYYRDADSDVPQYRVIYNNSEWKMSVVLNRKNPFSFAKLLMDGGGTLRVPISRPRILIDSLNRGFYVFRDIERGEKVSLAYCNDIKCPNWKIVDLTNFSVEAWEPSVDIERWKSEGVLDIYVQKAYGDLHLGANPEPVYVVEVRW